MAKATVRGSFNLFWGLVASSIISALSVTVVQRLLSPDSYALIPIALTAPNMIAMFRDWGVNSAMIQYIAQYKSENRLEDSRDMLEAGLLFELTLGFSLFSASFLSSDFLASFLGDSSISPLIRVTSLNILSGAILTATQSALLAYEKTSLRSITVICQSFLRVSLEPLLLISGLGVFGAILGTALALLIASLISTAILYLSIYRKLPKREGKRHILENMRVLLRYGLPMSISAISTGFLTQFYNVLMVKYCEKQAVGNYASALNFAVLLIFLAEPIATILFPAFSKIGVKKDVETLRSAFQSSVKYTALFIIPVTAGIIALSQPIIYTVVGDKYTAAPQYLAMYVITYLYTALGSLSVGGFLNGLGETKMTMKLTLITAAAGLPLSLLLIPLYGIAGLIFAALIAGIPSLAIGLLWIKRNYGVTVDWYSSGKILAASATAAAMSHLAIAQLSIPSWMQLIVGFLIFLAVYITLVPLIGALSGGDLKNLREMLSELGPFSKLFALLLSVIEKVLALKPSVDSERKL